MNISQNICFLFSFTDIFDVFFLGRNICATNNGGCEHICEERHGRFHRCKCRQGFKLASDKRRCHRKLMFFKKKNLFYLFEKCFLSF